MVNLDCNQWAMGGLYTSLHKRTTFINKLWYEVNLWICGYLCFPKLIEMRFHLDE